MNIYSDYKKELRGLLESSKSDHIIKGLGSFSSRPVFLNESKDSLGSINFNKPKSSLQSFSGLQGLESSYDQVLGEHPDFKHLKGTDNTEYHHIVSVFIDIKNSTQLFGKYSPELVRLFVLNLQVAAIHTMMSCGGYIQRLHGDGMLVYFGGKTVSKEKAIQGALMACSMFSYFMENDLKEIFEERDIRAIKTRIGIDFGDDEDVLWSAFGLMNMSEVSTCSLHTNLASKMQNNARPNGIVVGENVSKFDIDDYVDLVSKRKEEKHRYIYQDRDKGMLYKQYDFNWDKYLRHHGSFTVDLNGAVNFKLEASKGENANHSSLASIAATSRPYFY